MELEETLENYDMQGGMKKILSFDLIPLENMRYSSPLISEFFYKKTCLYDVVRFTFITNLLLYISWIRKHSISSSIYHPPFDISISRYSISATHNKFISSQFFY